MIRRVGLLLVLLAAPSCRNYDLYSRVSSENGSVPGDQYARYGKEQAEVVAISRRLAEVGPAGTDSAVAYARGLPDVAAVDADPLGHRLTVGFKSGWRVGIVPARRWEEAGRDPRTGRPGLPVTRPKYIRFRNASRDRVRSGQHHGARPRHGGPGRDRRGHRAARGLRPRGRAAPEHLLVARRGGDRDRVELPTQDDR